MRKIIIGNVLPCFKVTLNFGVAMINLGILENTNANSPSKIAKFSFVELKVTKNILKVTLYLPVRELLTHQKLQTLFLQQQ